MIPTLRQNLLAAVAGPPMLAFDASSIASLGRPSSVPAVASTAQCTATMMVRKAIMAQQVGSCRRPPAEAPMTAKKTSIRAPPSCEDPDEVWIPRSALS